MASGSMMRLPGVMRPGSPLWYVMTSQRSGRIPSPGRVQLEDRSWMSSGNVSSSFFPPVSSPPQNELEVVVELPGLPKMGSISRRRYADRSTPKRATMSRHSAVSATPVFRSS